MSQVDRMHDYASGKNANEIDSSNEKPRAKPNNNRGSSPLTSTTATSSTRYCFLSSFSFLSPLILLFPLSLGLPFPFFLLSSSFSFKELSLPTTGAPLLLLLLPQLPQQGTVFFLPFPFFLLSSSFTSSYQQQGFFFLVLLLLQLLSFVLSPLLLSFLFY